MNLKDFSRTRGHFIGGELIEGRGRTTFATLNPATGEPLCRLQEASPEDVAMSVRVARDAFRSGAWTGMTPAERALRLERMARSLERLSDEIAYLECMDSGKNLSASRGDAQGTARAFRYYAGLADKLEGRSIPLGPDYADFTVLEPYGVSAQIVPWNFPIQIAARSVAPALAAGNTVVIKTPELAPLSIYALAAAAAESGIPDGTLNIISGTGAGAGAALVKDPDIDHIVFTGSVETGRKILHAAAETITPCLVELGGKSAAIVFPDANLDRLVDNICVGIFTHAGQICSALSRLIVHADIHDELMGRLTSRIEALSIGPGIDDCELTPVISEHQLKTIEGLCERALTEGARLLCGGRRHGEVGFFFEPTVLTDVTISMEIAQKEVFGPVLAVSTFTELDEAIEMANGTNFGLVAGVFTEDLRRAHLCASRLVAGQVFVNEWFAGGIETPFGGVKQSGFGREKGVEAIYNYVRTKNIAVRYDFSR